MRSLLDKDIWDEIRRSIYRNSGYRCQICGGKGPDWPVECEEFWEYEHQSDLCGIAKLRCLKSLCPNCHSIRHLGKASIDGRLQKVIEHMAYINAWSKHHAEQVTKDAFELWMQRSHMSWSFDFDIINKLYGLSLSVDKETIENTHEKFMTSIN